MSFSSAADGVCTTCGSRIVTTASGDLGCLSCLLRTGLEEESVETTNSASPTSFGAYVIARHEDGSLHELGRGAMGITYLAEDVSLQRPVALKIIKADFGQSGSDARERFMREARAAAALRHPRVATVYQFGMDDDTGQYFCAMELVDGETLEERVRRTGPLDSPTVVEIARQVTAALAAAEARGLVHRDLKPGNIMVASESEDGKIAVKVIDFGVAKALQDAPDARTLTHGGFVGTPAFASPEQLRGKSIDVRSDIYSLGATMWFLITGTFPLRDGEPRANGDGSKPISPRLAHLKAAHVPARLRSLLMAMLAAEPAARPGTRELADRLEKIQAQMSGSGKSLRRSALVSVVAVLIGGGIWILQALETRPARAPSNAPPKSIAVLPFENLSDDKKNAYFTEGVQDEILTNLARVADLKVTSRTSVIQYKSGIARNLREIGQQLGVAHLLEGSVQRANNRIRVNAQLIDARTDAHLWAQTYDRDLADVFAIQSEIAKAIADQLQAKLSPQEKAAIEQPPTTDVIAFDLYSRAKSIYFTINFSANRRVKLMQAVDLLNQAVASDPSFFLAYCALADAQDTLYFFGGDRTAERLASAEAAIQAAFRLRPDAGEVHLAHAQHLSQGYFDYDGALAELEIARRTLPHNPRVIELAGSIALRQGKYEAGLRSLERALDLDPRNFVTLQDIASTYRSLRRYPEQTAILDRALAIRPDDADTKVARAWVDLEWKADTRPLHETIESIREKNPAALPSIANTWIFCALAEHDAAAAANALVALGENPFSFDAARLSRGFGEGLVARMMKDEGKARSAFTAARAQQEKIVQSQPNYGPALCALGLIDAGLGRKEDALREGRQAVELMPVEKDAYNGAYMVAYLAVIAAWVDERDLACEQLARATRLPGPLSYGQLKLLPYWDPLRGDPRFEKIVADLAPKK